MQTQQAQGRAIGVGSALVDDRETRQTAASVADTSDLSDLSDLADLADPSGYAQLMESICLVEFRDCLTRESAFLATMLNNNVK